jgi:hypothetical protein
MYVGAEDRLGHHFRFVKKFTQKSYKLATSICLKIFKANFKECFIKSRLF